MVQTAETTVAVIEGASPIEQETHLTEVVTDVEFRAGAITIDSDDDYQSAAEFGRLIKQRSAEVKAFFKPMKEAADRAHKEVVAREKAMLKPLESAEAILKQTMGGYVQEQERKRREAEEAARKAAQEEAERKMAEAMALESSGDNDGAELALEEAQIMDEAASSVTVSAEKPKAAGVSTKKDWEITGIDGSAVPVELNGIELRPVDTAAVMRLIRASKGQVKIPGVTYREKVQLSFRK